MVAVRRRRKVAAADRRRRRRRAALRAPRDRDRPRRGRRSTRTARSSSAASSPGWRGWGRRSLPPRPWWQPRQGARQRRGLARGTCCARDPSPADRGPLGRRRARPTRPPRGGRGARAPRPRPHPRAWGGPRRRPDLIELDAGAGRPPAALQRRPHQRARRRRDPRAAHGRRAFGRARALVAAAIAHVGLDNITAVVADVDVDEPGTDSHRRDRRARRAASPVDDEPRTTAVPSSCRRTARRPVVPVATSVGDVGQILSVRPVLSPRDRRRRRREDWPRGARSTSG